MIDFDFIQIPANLVWPLAIAIAWVAGEMAARWTGLPRISVYGLIGFALASDQAGFLSNTENSPVALLANVAFGLILFEFGYRINLRWLRANPWIGVTGLFEALCTFGAVYAVAYFYGTTTFVALLLASLAMSTSPAVIMRVINEQQSSGQVTERILHLSAMNCVLSIFAFKVVVGFWIFETSGNVFKAVSGSLIELAVSAGLGALFGILIPAIMRRLVNLAQEGTIAFAIAVMVLVAVTHSLDLSPVLAALTFGLVARHRRVTLSQAQRNFGALGGVLTVLLFVFAGTTLDLHRMQAGAGLALLLIAARFSTKTLGVAVFSRISGISWRKGVLTGVAMAPISIFVILLLEQSRHLGIALIDELVALAAITLFMEVLCPVITQCALIWARETPTENRA
ncbi:MAG: cation:proton antiporter [Burkholderiales bacterium]|nr:cation:proton antiporter [Burkholderiales bacterium]